MLGWRLGIHSPPPPFSCVTSIAADARCGLTFRIPSIINLFSSLHRKILDIFPLDFELEKLHTSTNLRPTNSERIKTSEWLCVLGECGVDGIYWKDLTHLTFCTNGRTLDIPCAPGSRNADASYVKKLSNISIVKNVTPTCEILYFTYKLNF